MTKRGTALVTAALMFLLAAVPAFGQDVPYPDVSADHWAYEAIVRLHHAGLIEGYPDGTFGGERTFTRYEMAMVFDRILGRYDAYMADALADLGIDISDVTAEFAPELALIDALRQAIVDVQRSAEEAREIAEAAAATADTAEDRAYRSRLAAERALAEAQKANETASMALALADRELPAGVDAEVLEELQEATRRAQRIAADAEAAALRAAAIAQSAFDVEDDSWKDTVEEVRVAAMRAQEIAADAEAAALKANAVADRALALADENEALVAAVEAIRGSAQRAQRVAADAEAAALKAQAMAERALAAEDVHAALDELQTTLQEQLDAVANRSYSARLTAERALNEARKAAETAAQAVALAEREDGADDEQINAVRLAAQRAQRVAADAEAAALRATAIAEMAFDAVDDSLAETVEQTRLASQRAQRIAANAEAAALIAQAMAAEALSTDEALAALAEAETAADRAYRARLTAQQALALGRQADGKADRALAMAEIAVADTAAVGEVAQEALDMALQADRLAYLAHLSAERALDVAEEARDRIEDVEDRLAVMPKIGGELSANYALANTDKPGALVDPRGPASGPKTENRKDIGVSVGLNAVVEPAEGVRVEGGIKFGHDVFSGVSTDVGLSNLFAQVTTPGTVRKAYFGGLTGGAVANGFNAFALDAARYGANASGANRAGAYADINLGGLDARVIASKTNDTDFVAGATTTLHFDDAMNVSASYVTKGAEKTNIGFGLFGETDTFQYNWQFGSFKGDAAMDGSFGGEIGDLTFGIKLRSIGQLFDGSDPDYFGKVYSARTDGIEAGHKDSLATVEMPLFGLNVGYEKGYRSTLLDTNYTDWHQIGFTDADIFGFDLSAHYYLDTRDQPVADSATAAYRVGLGRTINLGLPLNFSVVHADMTWHEGQPTPSFEGTHQAFGVELKDYEITDTFSVRAGYTLEKNPLTGAWNDHSRWTATLTDDNGAGFVIGDGDRTTMFGGATLAVGALTLSGDYKVANNDTNQGQVDVRTTDIRAAYSFSFLDGDATVGYDWQNFDRDGSGFFHDGSARSTFRLGYERAAWGGTVDAGYKLVTGRGDDPLGKKDARDMNAHLSYKYPVAQGMDFTLGGEWTNSEGNADADDDYFFSSVKAGFSLSF